VRNDLPLVLSVLALVVTGCGAGSDEVQRPAAQAPESDKLRPYRTVVEEHRDKPLADRVAIYLPLAQSLNPASKTRTYEESLRTLTLELLEAGDFGVLEALEERLEAGGRKRALWETVSYRGRTAGARRLAEKWASENPEIIQLARFRPGGVEFLLAMLEDEAADPRDRARSARELGLAGDVHVIPRLRKLEDDRTPVHGRSIRAGGPAPTLGESVKWAMNRLEQKEAVEGAG
jgi:hypothetical protein